MKFSKTCLLMTAIAAVGTSASAVVVYETDYTTRSDNGNPFADGGELRFQDGWLGQTGYIVDSDAPGTVSASGTFLRTLNNRGVNGGSAGGDGSGESSVRGFQDGDIITAAATLQFDLASSPNQELASIGFRPNFASGGFDAQPTVGLKVAYNSFGDGSLKVFSNLSRQGFIGADNAFAVFVSGAEGGFNSGGGGGAADLVTDSMLFEYTAVYQSGSWVATGLTVTNGTTVVADAATENPTALESTVYAGTEAFYGQRFLGNAAGATTTSDSMRFEFTPIPEPASIGLFGLGAAAMLLRRRG